MPRLIPIASLTPIQLAALSISQFLYRHGILHVFIGGFAVQCLTGMDRRTQDVDLMVDASYGVHYIRTLLRLEGSAFFAIIGEAAHYLALMHATTGVKVEILLRGPDRMPPCGPGTSVLPNGLTFPTPSPTEMIREKLLACAERERPKTVDMRDINHLYSVFRGQLDARYIQRSVSAECVVRTLRTYPQLESVLQLLGLVQPVQPRVVQFSTARTVVTYFSTSHEDRPR